MEKLNNQKSESKQQRPELIENEDDFIDDEEDEAGD
jgi:hypothetical protein